MKTFKTKQNSTSARKKVFMRSGGAKPHDVVSVPSSNKKLKKVQDRNDTFDPILESKKEVKPKILFKSMQCKHHNAEGVRCTNRAAGKSTICTVHGGSAKKELIPFDEMTLSTTLGNITSFDPSYHPIKFIELSRTGMSDIEIAAEFGISKTTIRKWSANIKEFNIAYEAGKTMYEAFFLRTGTRNLNNDRFNTQLFKFMTGNMLGYSDKIETKNQNTSLHGVLLVPGSMSMDEWEAKNIADDEEAVRKNEDIIQ